MAYNIIPNEAITEIFALVKAGLNEKVAKESGKGLSANDLTATLKKAYDQAVTDIAALKTAGVEKNIINTVKVNGTALTPDSSRAVDITVPTTTQIKSQIEAYGYQNSTQVESAITAKGYQTAEQVNSAITAKGYQTATQVNAAIEGKGYQTSSQVQSAINEALSDITGIDIQVVTSLPTTGVKGVIYLVAHSHGTNDSYDEYVWVASKNAYEKIGNTDVDLSAYAKTADFTEVTASDIDTLWESVS